MNSQRNKVLSSCEYRTKRLSKRTNYSFNPFYHLPPVPPFPIPQRYPRVSNAHPKAAVADLDCPSLRDYLFPYCPHCPCHIWLAPVMIVCIDYSVDCSMQYEKTVTAAVQFPFTTFSPLPSNYPRRIDRVWPPVSVVSSDSDSSNPCRGVYLS